MVKGSFTSESGKTSGGCLTSESGLMSKFLL